LTSIRESSVQGRAGTRREFLKASAGLAAAALPGSALAATATPSILKPPRLREGDTVALVNTAPMVLQPEDRPAATRSLTAAGLKVKCGVSLNRAPGSPPPSDAARADELNRFFADPDVRAILPLRGGWGAARLLPHLDYEAIRKNPQVLLGFSDFSALLLGIHARTGLVTFHGPMGLSSWEPFTLAHARQVLFEARAARLVSDPRVGMHRLVSGRARGPLCGGNLTVLSSMVGSPYLRVDPRAILFLEEVEEPYSEVDRMMTQLDLAGILRPIGGFVFGQCIRCDPPALNRRLDLDRVLEQHVTSLGVPAWRGAPIGHGERQLTLPIGIAAEIDADHGTIELLEPAVA
jgi:muramoyltetrapeptide carboxypeptidase